MSSALGKEKVHHCWPVVQKENVKGEPVGGVMWVGAVIQKESGPQPGIIPRCHWLQTRALCCSKAGFLLLLWFVELSSIYFFGSSASIYLVVFSVLVFSHLYVMATTDLSDCIAGMLLRLSGFSLIPCWNIWPLPKKLRSESGPLEYHAPKSMYVLKVSKYSLKKPNKWTRFVKLKKLLFCLWCNVRTKV